MSDGAREVGLKQTRDADRRSWELLELRELPLNEDRETEGDTAHRHLLAIAPRHPLDYQPFGFVDRQDPYLPDCSCGCKWYVELAGYLASDWGVCANPRSHRCGWVTFEHQGCDKFEYDARLDRDDDG